MIEYINPKIVAWARCSSCGNISLFRLHEDRLQCNKKSCNNVTFYIELRVELVEDEGAMG